MYVNIYDFISRNIHIKQAVAPSIYKVAGLGIDLFCILLLYPVLLLFSTGANSIYIDKL